MRSIVRHLLPMSCAVLLGGGALSSSSAPTEAASQASDTEAQARKGFPEFSWNQVPLYAHLGIGSGLKPDQYELMAKPHEEQYRVAREQITFPLACFLAGAESHCYFCYTWGWLGEYGTFDWYPEFDKSLGVPKGEAKREGWKYTRELEHASVFVDVEKKTGKIDWKER